MITGPKQTNNQSAESEVIEVLTINVTNHPCGTHAYTSMRNYQHDSFYIIEYLQTSYIVHKFIHAYKARELDGMRVGIGDSRLIMEC